MNSRVRIIGGRWKRSLLPVPVREGLRPTPDRVRETLFNWLGQDLEGWTCLELFAGTGVLGFEAASRGAARVTMVERDQRLAKGLAAAKARLDAGAVTVVGAEALNWLQSTRPEAHNLVLLDPPYRERWLERVLPMMLPWLLPEGRIYAECEFPLTDGWLQAGGVEGLEVMRAGKAGQVHYHLLGRSRAPTSDPGGAPDRDGATS